MSTEATPAQIASNDERQNRVLRGRNAELVLNNPAYVEAFQGMRAQIIEALADSNTADVQRLQLLTQRLQLLDTLQVNLDSYMRSGQEAGDELERAQAELDRQQAELDARAATVFGRGVRAAQQFRQRWGT